MTAIWRPPAHWAVGESFSGAGWATRFNDNVRDNFDWLKAFGGQIISDNYAFSTSVSITLSSIPATYRHLLVVVSVRSTAAAANDTLLLRFNADTGANYDQVGLTASGSAITGAEAFAQTSVSCGPVPAANATSDTYGLAYIQIAHYAQSGNQKGAAILSGAKWTQAAGGMAAARRGGYWRNTAVVTSLVVLCASGQIAGNSLVSLYGIGV